MPAFQCIIVFIDFSMKNLVVFVVVVRGPSHLNRENYIGLFLKYLVF